MIIKFTGNYGISKHKFTAIADKWAAEAFIKRYTFDQKRNTFVCYLDKVRHFF